MTDKPKPPPKPNDWSAFRKLLGKIARVPKAEIEEQEREYQRERERLRNAR
jgi:hypothetical protein